MYRATDTKLAREIALKLLPPGVASDPDGLTRFQREARAFAALETYPDLRNHALRRLTERPESQWHRYIFFILPAVFGPWD